MNDAGREVQFRRDCEVVQIPAGHKLLVPKGTGGTVTQSLGGAYTLQIPAFGALVRLQAKDLDAIGLEAPASSASAEASAPAGDLESQVWETLKTCYDPEIPVNIVDLGLVYDMRIAPAPSGGKQVAVKMTLTAQGCGMGAHIAADAEARLTELPGVDEARVEIVWDPPWGPQMISPAGREKLGID